MTTTLDTRLMPAQNTTDPALTTGTIRGEVKSVAIFESRSGRVKRAWDELSEIDRAVLLESVRQRRKAQEQKQKIYNEIYRLRVNR